MDRKTHKELLSKYFSLGGDQVMMKKLSSFSLVNHSKLKYLIKQFDVQSTEEKKEIESDKSESEPEIKIIIQKRESKFSDLISNYPQELHPVFKSRYDHWLSACSLKQQLNSVDRLDEITALKIQWEILGNIEAMEDCQRALDYYQDHKRILPIKTNKNFSGLTAIELLKTRNNLRSNITKRIKTLNQMESNLPEIGDKEYNLKLHLVNRKREKLQEYINQVTELDKLINQH
ncbi:hypothetical protein [Chryseobacterium sp. MEBOG07]|uniref:hypothetical protein n=1 Tax=Chryseobacterium sp. MEBOG07 TaxID=2879939 RepID=UPI001F26474F|nr:hypothetical protein [Chryseobacterium sp. MEBOG07]UKB81253.1 hypothetical protein LF886_09760 [Chryseobacterium sp. MEBOG07]